MVQQEESPRDRCKIQLFASACIAAAAECMPYFTRGHSTRFQSLPEYTARSFRPAKAIKKLLRCPERRFVEFGQTVQEPKSNAEFCVQRLSVVADDL